MKQTRIIRISFLLSAALIVGAFWAGFYFGENSTEPGNILTASEENYDTSIKSTTNNTATDTAVSDAQAQEQEEAEQSVESMKDIKEACYYLKASDGYLAVYDSNTDQVYFETGLKPTDLPADLQEKAKTGISFSSLEELYSFLENYSS